MAIKTINLILFAFFAILVCCSHPKQERRRIVATYFTTHVYTHPFFHTVSVTTVTERDEANNISIAPADSLLKTGSGQRYLLHCSPGNLYRLKNTKETIWVAPESKVGIISTGLQTLPDALTLEEGEVFMVLESLPTSPLILQAGTLHAGFEPGSSFNYKSYPGENASVLSVLKGTAAVTVGPKKLKLTAGKELSLDKKTGKFLVRGCDSFSVAGWTAGFGHSYSLDEYMRTIARFYNKKIIWGEGVDPGFRYLIGTRMQGDTLQRSLSVVGSIMGFDLNLSHDTIYVHTHKGK